MALPKGVHEKHGRYWLVKTVDGRRVWVPLTRVEDGPEALDTALNAMTQELPPFTIGQLLARFRDSKAFARLAEATQYEYKRAIKSRLIPVFGALRIHELQPKHIAKFLQDGEDGDRSVLANRERAIMQSAFNYAMRHLWADSNPCAGIPRNVERPSRTYVTHEQYLDAYRRAPGAVQNLMHIGYLTGLRLVDLTRLRKVWVADDGIYIIESKTSKRRKIKMSLYLRRALDRALDYAPPDTPYLLVTARGAAWQKWSVQSAWKRLAPGFPFRQIRAKAQTDAREKNVLGHSGQMLARYTRFEELEPVG
jgi:site-specific recombinase XerD